MGIELLGVKAADALLAQYAPKEMRTRMQRATMAGARVARPFIRAEAPKGKTGNLRKSVKARKGNASVGIAAGTASALVGPTSAHRHLVIRGHEIVGHEPNKTRAGRRTKSNPFVDRAMARALPLVANVATKELMKP